MREETYDTAVAPRPELLPKADVIPEPSGSSSFFLIVLLGAMAGMGPLAIDMYLPSFPAIAQTFGVTTAAVERTLASYFAGLAIGQLIYGPIADRFGRKRPLYFGLTLFGIASVACAMASSVQALIGLRFAQALGGCAEMVIARAIVRDRFRPRDTAKVFSSLMLVMGVAPILAPLVGGWLAVHIGWRSIFRLLAGFATLCLVAVTFFLNESLPESRRQRNSPAEVVIGYAQLLQDRAFMVYTVAGSLIFGGIFAYVAGCPFVFIELFHVPQEHFGLYFGTNAAGLIGAAQLNRVLLRRWEPRKVLRVCLIIACVAGVTLSTTTLTHFGGFPGLLIPLFVYACMFGLVMPTTTALAMAPHGRTAGAASAVLGSLQFLIGGSGGLFVSLLHNGTAVPMTGVIALFSVLALLTQLVGQPEHVDWAQAAAVEMH